MTTTRPIMIEDGERLAELRRLNREFLAPWEPTRTPEHFTPAGQRAAIEELLAGQEVGRVVAHVILDGERIVGQVTLTNIVRGPFQSCNLGYWVGARDNGRGHATAAVGRIARLAFAELALHRIEAGTLLHNRASQRVLERNAFKRFGLAPRYLQIAGRWQDHILYQRLAGSAAAGSVDERDLHPGV